ncbi:MAG: 5-guanidino-2-oxopentanoate decarboxylase [Solirubrobacteraceae bacterium]|nr:5-guanidino-2-oxopentanoate decarboxylase [Solirubrobacteraceae bacterium]
MSSGADVIVAALEDAGVEVCFGLPGVHNLALWEALRESSIRLVGVRHEQAAGYAADGYARATGRLGVALTTTGPGAANTLAAVGEAWASRSPVLVIATDIPTTLRRDGVYRGVLHETDGQAAMFAPVVKASLSGPEAIEQAIAAALAVPARPVYLEVATDLLRAPAGDPAPAEVRPAVTARGGSVGGERPLLWVGGGARDQAVEVVALAERLGAPVLETYGGRGIVPAGHPLRVGFPPHVPAAGALWDQADVVISIGSDLDGMNTQNWALPQPPRLLAINVDPDDAGKNYRVDAHVGFDVEGDGDPWIDLHQVRAQACDGLDERALHFLDALSFGLPHDVVLVCDMCIPGYWAGGFHPFGEPRRLLYPVGWGTLGFAFPAALGAALAQRGPAVALCGDGGFLFAAGELATVAQEQLPLTTVIVDDGGYGMLRFDQDQAGARRFGVDLRTPDFEAVARAFGLQAETVDDLGDAFGEALARHVADPEPSVLVARAEALVPPPTTSPRWYRRR